jgi:ABC-2 type transport system permease protein
MRYTILIALREFQENAKTKGFWIGIFMFPLILLIGIGVSTKLAKAEPARYFVVVDKSGAFAEPIKQAIEWEYQKSVLEALAQYVHENQRPGLQPPVDVPTYQAAVDAFIAAGGKDVYLARLRPALRENAPAFKEPDRRFIQVELPKEIDAGASADVILAGLKPYLVGERQIEVNGGHMPLFAAMVIKPDGVEGALRWTGEEAIQYWSTNLAVNDLTQKLQNALNGETRRRLYASRGVDAGTVREIEATWTRLGTFDPAKAAGEETVSTADRITRAVPVGLVYLLWMSIFTVMQMLLSNTIEEKSNRIAEVLLSSVTPNEIMLGKLIGIAGIGLTMVGVWLGTAFVGLRFWQGPGASELSQALDAVAASGLIPTFLLCFLLGYLIYAGLFLSIGALCNDVKEAQSFQGPLMLIMMVPFLTMVFINRDPHGTLATILTWIPLYTPFTLMNRAAANPPTIEIVGATLLMIATAVLFIWSAGRIFRIALLRAGNRPKFAEIVQWVRGRTDA